MCAIRWDSQLEGRRIGGLPLLVGLVMGLHFGHGCGNGVVSSEEEVAGRQGGETVEESSDELALRPEQPFDWCQPGTPPDASCHAARRAPDSEEVALATALAAAFREEHPATAMAWNWEDAVLMLALIELHRVTGEAELLAYVREWLDHHIATGFLIGMSDNCVPAAAAIPLSQEAGTDPKYAAVVAQALNYLYEQAKRTADGGISHLGTIDIVTLWVDSLYMFGAVLLGYSEATGDEKALEEYGFQFRLFARRLQSQQGWYTHAADWIMPQTPGIFWGRGNGWVAVAGSQYLRLLVNRGEEDPQARVALTSLLAAVALSQDSESGLWWTIVNRPGEGYLETSASALFAYGLARSWRYGLLDDQALAVIAGALHGVRSRVVTDAEGRPRVTGVSGPTTADKLESYLAVPLADDLPYGVGAVILALVESSGLPLPEVD